MAHQSNLIANNIEEYLKQHESKGILRFLTCGSVDDGKSSLIGRLLFETKMVFEDHLTALEEESKKFGTTGEKLDLALLVDGLAAEREQGITIDVAYRFFSTENRKFIVADAPGHEQYTRHMATGASTADVAVVLVDAQKGVVTQTRRHSFIASMMGVKHVVLAVNKMDMVGYSKERFESIQKEYEALVADLGFESVAYIPVSALMGDNVAVPSTHMKWYGGRTLVEYLETIDIIGDAKEEEFCMPVQLALRPNSEFRGYAGRISSGAVAPGDAIYVLPSGKQTQVKQIVTADGFLNKAEQGASVTLTFEDDIDVSRGDVVVSGSDTCHISDQFEAKLLWLSEKPMVSSRQYVLQLGTAEAKAIPAKLKYEVNVENFKEKVSNQLGLNGIGVCNIALDRNIAFRPYAEDRTMGSFILVDRATNETVAMGMVHHGLRRASNLHRQSFVVDKKARAEQKHQTPSVLWFTGLSGAGKSTIADLVEQKLHAMGKHTMLLDGDNVRLGLNKDLSFTVQDRAENIRRIAEVAKLMNDAGLVVLASFISPFAAERSMARELIGTENFVEVFVDTPLEEAEKRDTKGLYKKARAGKIPNFTGIGSPYEMPEAPELHLETLGATAEELADKVICYILESMSE